MSSWTRYVVDRLTGRVLEEEHSPVGGSYFVGLSLGRPGEFSAVALLERQGGAEEWSFIARHLERFPAEIGYPDVSRALAEMLTRPPVAGSRPQVALDITGAGEAVGDLFRRARLDCWLRPVSITAGSAESRSGDTSRVPKVALVSLVQAALQTKRLKVASSVTESATLIKDLKRFRAKITVGLGDDYASWREGARDDLVFSVALALWCGDQKSGGVVKWDE